jgi:hypothetical protein
MRLMDNLLQAQVNERRALHVVAVLNSVGWKAPAPSRVERSQNISVLTGMTCVRAFTISTSASGSRHELETFVTFHRVRSVFTSR